MTMGAIGPPKPQDIVTADHLHSLIADNELFAHMSLGQIARLVEMITGVRWVEAGDFLVHEGDDGDEFFVISEGSFEVLKTNPETQKHFPLAVLTRGRSIGEVALLHSGPRSASVRALERSCVLVIRISDINALALPEERIDVRMRMNLAAEIGRRLRDTNETTVKFLQERLAESEKRAEMGKFLTRVLIGLALYMFAMGVTSALSQIVDTGVVNAVILMAFAYGVYRTVKTSPYPMSAYGFTLVNWRRHAVEGVIMTVPALVSVVAMKAFLVALLPDVAGNRIFDLSRSSGLGGLEIAALCLLYALFSPVQEMIARSGIQCSCQMFLSGEHRVAESIFLSSLLFSATHLHVSLAIALLVFPAGLWWGWLFSKQGSLVGCSVSHIITGLFAFFVVGFKFVL